MYKNGIEEWKSKGNCKNTYITTLKYCSVIGCVLLTGLVSASFIFKDIVFGIAWDGIQPLLLTFSILYFIQFIGATLSRLNSVSQNQRSSLLWQCLFFISNLILLFCVFLIPLVFYTYTLLYAFLNSLLYIALIILVYKKSLK